MGFAVGFIVGSNDGAAVGMMVGAGDGSGKIMRNPTVEAAQAEKKTEAIQIRITVLTWDYQITTETLLLHDHHSHVVTHCFEIIFISTETSINNATFVCILLIVSFKLILQN